LEETDNQSNQKLIDIDNY